MLLFALNLSKTSKDWLGGQLPVGTSKREFDREKYFLKFHMVDLHCISQLSLDKFKN